MCSEVGYDETIWSFRVELSRSHYDKFGTPMKLCEFCDVGTLVGILFTII